MAILSDNNRWKYSCREVCAQMSHMRNLRIKETVRGKWKLFFWHITCHFVCFLNFIHSSLNSLSPVCPPSLSPSPSLLNLLI